MSHPNEYYSDNESEISIDSGASTPLIPITEEELTKRNEAILKFRDTLLKWKKKELDAITETEQNPAVLNEYLKKSALLYTNILEALGGRASFPKEIIFDFDLIDPIERANIEHYAHTDLVTFPFTYSSSLIDRLPETEEPKLILSNKE